MLWLFALYHNFQAYLGLFWYLSAVGRVSWCVSSLRAGGQSARQKGRPILFSVNNAPWQLQNTKKKYKEIQKEITEGNIYIFLFKFVLVFAFLFNFHAGGAVNNCEKKSWLFIISCICISAPSSFAHFSISAGCSSPHLEVLLKSKEVSLYPSSTITLNLSTFDPLLRKADLWYVL